MPTTPCGKEGTCMGCYPGCNQHESPLVGPSAIVNDQKLNGLTTKRLGEANADVGQARTPIGIRVKKP